MTEKEKLVSNLPPELMIEIMLYCDASDVINFAEAVSVKRLDIWDVIDNKKLWQHVVISPDEKFIHEKWIKYMGKYKTKSLKIEWKETNKQRRITKFLLDNIRS